MLVELPELLSAYLPQGGTRLQPSRALPADEQLKLTKGWKASTATARDLIALDAAVLAAGGARLRLVEVYRDPERQREVRERYERWIAAGKPKPGTSGFSEKTMKAARVSPVGESQHGWGAAVDIDQDALRFPDCPIGSDKALARFWQLAREHGFTPIIARPVVSTSESWHFDHLGPMRVVDELAKANGEERGNALAARAGHVLSGYVFDKRRALEFEIQARLLASGIWCGWIDGDIGPKTKAALEACDAPKGTPADVLAWLRSQQPNLQASL